MSALTTPRRLTPFFDVIGAVLIFGSWIASNAFSERARAQAGTHGAVIERTRQFRLYQDFSRRVVDIQSELVRTRTLAEGIALRLESLEGEEEQPIEPRPWTGMTATEVRELSEFLDSMNRYTRDLPISDQTRQTLHGTQEGIKALTSAFDAAYSEYERLRDATADASSDAEDVTDEWEEHRRSVDELWKHCDDAKGEMVHIGNAIVESASEEAASAGKWAAQFKGWSYLLYIAGTAMILMGRLRTVLRSAEASRKTSDGEAAPGEGERPKRG